MIKNKKSQFLMYGLIGALVVGIFFAIAYSGNSRDFNLVGDYALSLVGISKEAEKALLYIDQSAKYSLQQAIYDIGQNGGVSEIENIGTDESFADYQCGKFKDAYIWYEIKKTDKGYDFQECFDENSVSSNLMYLFDINLNQYISSAPKEMPIDNYNYDIKGDSEIIATAKEPITFNLLKYEKEVELPPLKPRQYKVDAEGKMIKDKKSTEIKTPEKGKGITEDDTKIKSLVDFSGVASSAFGKETIDITGLCQKGNKCVLTGEAYNLLLTAQKKAQEKKLSLEVTSSYRTKQQQIDIWEGKTASRWAQRIPNEKERRAKVCYPYGDDVEQRCPHLTGNAVDIKFKGKTTKTMTGADWQQLHNIMTSAGWVRYGDEKGAKKGETWHFECCGTSRYARAKEQGVTAIV